MQFRGIVGLVLLAVSFCLSGTAFAAPPKGAVDASSPHVFSHYSVLVDASTGKVLWGRNQDVHREMASTTKIMTAILLIERGRLTDFVVGPNGIDKVPESSLHLSPGEKISLHDLLYAMLLRSANDTAIAGADYLAGSVPAFAGLMNAKAREIGADNTHFVTPNGLYDKNHYSTAADLAKMACYATNNLPLFNQIVRTQRYKVTRSVHIHDIWVKNTATTFLKDFPGADGIKTGYISEAGHCFVGSATRISPEGRPWRLIAVALDSNRCREDVESMLNYGFANYQPQKVMSQGTPVGSVTVPGGAMPVPVVASADIRVAISRHQPAPPFQMTLTPLTALPQAPVDAGAKLGTITIFAHGKVQATGDAIAAQSVQAQPFAALNVPKGRAATHIARNLSVGVLVLVLLGWGIRNYVRTTAKSARRRRNRLAASMRRVD